MNPSEFETKVRKYGPIGHRGLDWQSGRHVLRTAILLLLSFLIASVPAVGLEVGQWVNIHQMTADDDLVFERQRHSGSAWDSKRQRLLVFGSDTHGKNWDNSVYAFDLEARTWLQLTIPDPRNTYRVNARGLPVAGVGDAERPWAMHTFDTLSYIPSRDQLIVASAPKHLAPGRFGDWMKGTWEGVKKHPSWIFELDRHAWSTARGRAQDFFPYATAYAQDQARLFGFRPGKIFEFDFQTQAWVQVAANVMPGFHTQAVYDQSAGAFVMFGNNKKSNDIYAYAPGDKTSIRMPTHGIRPSGAEHVPLAYHSKLQETIALIDQQEGAETWAYNLHLDSWRRLEIAKFPFALQMNYHLQYSEKNNLLVLVASQSVNRHIPEVWVLRL